MLNIFLFEEKIAILEFEFFKIAQLICNNKLNNSFTTKKTKINESVSNIIFQKETNWFSPCFYSFISFG